MENPNIGRIMRVGNSESIVIPAAIRKALKWMRGDRVVFAVYDENIIAIRRLTQNELRNLNQVEVEF